MDTSHTRLNLKDQSILDRITENNFTVPLNKYEEILFAWFLFAISNRGAGFSFLSEEDFNSFLQHLREILKELYKANHSSEKSLIDRKEDSK